MDFTYDDTHKNYLRFHFCPFRIFFSESHFNRIHNLLKKRYKKQILILFSSAIFQSPFPQISLFFNFIHIREKKF